MTTMTKEQKAELTALAARFPAIHAEAMAAALKKANEDYDTLGDKGACGFAWVEVAHVSFRTKLGKVMAQHGFDKGFGKGTIQLWNPSKFPVQSVYILERSAWAYAEVLKRYGFAAWCNSRLD